MDFEMNINDNILDNKSLGNKIADIIRERVISGFYPQGSRLTESEFAKSLGVSHFCVREAFGIVETEGLIRSIRHKYTQVVSYSNQDIEEIYALRLSLEKLCAEICIKKGRIQLDKLKEQADHISHSKAETLDDLLNIVEADIAYHEIIINSSGNIRVINIWKGLKNQIKTILYEINKRDWDMPMSVTVNSRGHFEIARAFEQSDLESLISLLTAHMEDGLKRCLDNNRTYAVAGSKLHLD